MPAKDFQDVIEKYRKISFSEKDKGSRFERLMKAYLLTDPKYAYKFKKVWLWDEFPAKNNLGEYDTGIDLVAITDQGEYWAIQCKCYQEDSIISKKDVDTFFTTSGRSFLGEDKTTTHFTYRLWIDTTRNPFTNNALEAFSNQNIPVGRLGLFDLSNAPVDWEKLEKYISGEEARTDKKVLRPHQTEALTKTNIHFKNNNRGKLIMACGTGKTLNSLRIAENETNGKGFILFLVPSIALLGQTLNEWYADALEPINAVCICSDPEVTKKKKKLEDIDTSSVIDLAVPASTNVNSIIKQFKDLEEENKAGLTVVFSTYQSIEVIAEAQKALQKIDSKFKEFDLIICDEAHRTTGFSLVDEDETAFTKVHNNEFIKAKKRLYMTATPRIYDDELKGKAIKAEAVLCSMDDPSLYGEEIYRIGFGEAVEKGLLTDYKVLILTLNENDVPPAIQKMITDQENEINTDDASKLIGCINALSKQILGDNGVIKKNDPEPMRRAVAFCQSIAVSKKITNAFNSASKTYIEELPQEIQEQTQLVASQHIDGTMNASTRNELLAWLKEEPKERECRVLTNVRCLSEGVDVPTLDAVLFLSAKNSQVDVVQSVGRVMRKSPGKKYGYIIIPIIVPADIEADKALDNNERYKVVWTVLNALRAHDDRFNAIVNKIDLNKNRPEQILIGRSEISFDKDGNPIYSNDKNTSSKDISNQIALQFEALQSVVFAKMVNKVGDRGYWEQWGKDVSLIAQRQIIRINDLITSQTQHQEAFEKFLLGLKQNINQSITKDQAVEMLSQHIITKPVFEALFEGYSFAKNNTISVSMQTMLDLLESLSIDKDNAILDKFYDSVRKRASGIDNAEGRQKIIIELYDTFFKEGFPKMVDQLGIVYTPVEVVDFIIHSVEDVLKKEFSRSLTDENIHILDPFTGTGTFMTRLLQSGLILPKDLPRKYKSELHANEIVLLAYYIAAINIENTYHDIIKEQEFESFEGIVLTDTFQMGETDEGNALISDMFEQNSERVNKQKKAPLRVIIGNPPYSAGQKSANDKAQNQSYPKLDSRIANTYVKNSTAGLTKSMYDSYIKAFRWSTDKLDPINGGIIAFVSNGSWLDTNSADGFRKSLETEFSSIYVFNLRGNTRTNGELGKKEAGNVFSAGSRTPISITILVKKPKQNTDKATIHYHDIGDYLKSEEKLKIIKDFKTIGNIPWVNIQSNKESDWTAKRNEVFSTLIPIEPSKKYDLDSKSFFVANSLGIVSARDAWVYNFSKNELTRNIKKTIEHYNNELDSVNKSEKIEPEMNSKLGSWSRDWLNQFGKKKHLAEKTYEYRKTLYRPFTITNLYFADELNQERYQLPKLFPNKESKNLVISISGSGSSNSFTTLISNMVFNYDMLGKTQGFPLYYYEKLEKSSFNLFDSENDSEYARRDAITDFILKEAQTRYGKVVTKEDIFYYVYGFLHAPIYRQKFANDLKKMLPKLPLVEKAADFWSFSKVGRKLAGLHLNYEEVKPLDSVIITGEESKNYQVEKMRFPKKDQKDTIIYNGRITISNIPDKAYQYIVNGKSAIEWIMERYQVSTHKDSGIKNDPNDWALEQNKPTYIIDLLLSIISLSVQTVDLVASLPNVEFGDSDTKFND